MNSSDLGPDGVRLTPKMKAIAKAVEQDVDAYIYNRLAAGLAPEDIERELKMEHKIEVHAGTIRRWMTRFRIQLVRGVQRVGDEKVAVTDRY